MSEDAQQFVVGKDGLEVLETDPAGRQNTIPLVERVLERLNKWPEHEDGIRRKRGSYEQPALQTRVADPWKKGPRR